METSRIVLISKSSSENQNRLHKCGPKGPRNRFRGLSSKLVFVARHSFPLKVKQCTMCLSRLPISCFVWHLSTQRTPCLDAKNATVDPCLGQHSGLSLLRLSLVILCFNTAWVMMQTISTIGCFGLDVTCGICAPEKMEETKVDTKRTNIQLPKRGAMAVSLSKPRGQYVHFFDTLGYQYFHFCLCQMHLQRYLHDHDPKTMLQRMCKTN